MRRKPFNPLDMIPSPDAIRERLEETQTLERRLRILLDVAERLESPLVTANKLPAPERPQAGASHG